MKIKCGFFVGFIIKYWFFFWIKEVVLYVNVLYFVFVL